MPQGFTAGGKALLFMAWVWLILLSGCRQEAREVPADSVDTVPALTAHPVLTLSGVGFENPASVLHDGESDVYLVSNVDGEGAEMDGNGFLSRVGPDGEILALRWVDGAEPGTTLNAPRGLALLADTLLVADVDCLRRFHRVSGAPLGELCLDHASRLTDVAVGARGQVYFSDRGAEGSRGAVYLLRPFADVPQKLTLSDGTVLEGGQVDGPSGIVTDARSVYIATFGSGEIWQVTPQGERIPLISPSELAFGGIVFLDEMGFLVSSQGESAVMRVDPRGGLTPLVQNLETPADLGYDALRNRLLIPLTHADEVRIMELR